MFFISPVMNLEAKYSPSFLSKFHLQIRYIQNYPTYNSLMWGIKNDYILKFRRCKVLFTKQFLFVYIFVIIIIFLIFLFGFNLTWRQIFFKITFLYYRTEKKYLMTTILFQNIIHFSVVFNDTLV